MKKLQPLQGPAVKAASIALVALVSVGLALEAAAAQFKLGVDANNFIENPPPIPSNNYPAPVMVPPMQGAATYDNPPPRQHTLQGNSGQSRLQGGTTSVALPPAFMGSWLVQGHLSGVDAATPQFQQDVSRAFNPNTQNTWNIAGSPQQGYQMSNDIGVSTTLTIYKVSKNQAFIRYQHPMGKVMAQEAIVMQLQNGGATFEGLERISIIKDGQQPPRAKVTYQLNGQRQR
jgi:hypothetical protein